MPRTRQYTAAKTAVAALMAVTSLLPNVTLDYSGALCGTVFVLMVVEVARKVHKGKRLLITSAQLRKLQWYDKFS